MGAPSGGVVRQRTPTHQVVIRRRGKAWRAICFECGWSLTAESFRNLDEAADRHAEPDPVDGGDPR
jgi:hypothetical protein